MNATQKSPARRELEAALIDWTGKAEPDADELIWAAAVCPDVHALLQRVIREERADLEREYRELDCE